MIKSDKKPAILEMPRRPQDLDAGAKGSAIVYDPVCGEGKYVLTPAAAAEAVIHGPAVFGVRPGSPFRYTIPATGVRPMSFSVENLPQGLQANEQSGIISGWIADLSMREYEVTLVAENRLGRSEKIFRIRVGDTICLTPPLGWNSWNCWGHRVDQSRVLASARAMAVKGLREYGWTYVNIDDAWQGIRGGAYNAIQGHPGRFPDLGALCDEIHALGLKVGIYSSPWIMTYAGFIGGSSANPDGMWDDDAMNALRRTDRKRLFRVGQYTFDENDAAQWAEWGIDYLKYDWNPNDPECTLRMARALRHCGRDIIYSLSNTAPLDHADLYAREVNCWRTAGDLKDRWDHDGIHLNIVEQWKLHREWMEEGVRGGPGHFPDPDMLVVGDVDESCGGKGPGPTRLTPDEQYAHISLWVLWAAPLLIGCPIERMDDFTLGLLTNTEVLAVHQDARAVPGRSVDLQDGAEAVIRELDDGSKAIGLFNRNETAEVVTLDWKTAGLSGRATLRDLWRRQDIGTHQDSFSVRVRPHGVVLIHAENR